VKSFLSALGSGGKLGYWLVFMRRHLSSTPSDQKVVVATGKRSESFVYLSGSISMTQLDMIPEAHAGLPIVKQWIEEILFSLNPSRPELPDAIRDKFPESYEYRLPI